MNFYDRQTPCCSFHKRVNFTRKTLGDATYNKSTSFLSNRSEMSATSEQASTIKYLSVNYYITASMNAGIPAQGNVVFYRKFFLTDSL